MSVSEHLSYLFEDSALASMRSFIDRETLFAFDLDGTLAPIATDPGTIGIPVPIRQELATLNENADVAVITGRARQDARLHLGISPRYLIGNHGAEGLPGWEDKEDEFVRTTNQWQCQLDVLLPIEDRVGILIENKGATLSIHYRHAVNFEVAHNMILDAIGRLVPQPRRINGKCIENLIPADAPDKGAALRLLMHKAGCMKGFFAGDDETDEDVFRLNDANIFTVCVEKRSGSKARFYLQEQQEIVRLLREINKIILPLKNGSAKVQP
jgi:trehalose 6-phosphate phosphatase